MNNTRGGKACRTVRVREGTLKSSEDDLHINESHNTSGRYGNESTPVDFSRPYFPDHGHGHRPCRDGKLRARTYNPLLSTSRLLHSSSRQSRRLFFGRSHTATARADCCSAARIVLNRASSESDYSGGMLSVVLPSSIGFSHQAHYLGLHIALYTCFQRFVHSVRVSFSMVSDLCKNYSPIQLTSTPSSLSPIASEFLSPQIFPFSLTKNHRSRKSAQRRSRWPYLLYQLPIVVCACSYSRLTINPIGCGITNPYSSPFSWRSCRSGSPSLFIHRPSEQSHRQHSPSI